MRKLVLAGATAIALSAPALAADRPVPYKAAPAAPAPVFNWTGFYVGGLVSYGWGDPRHCDQGNPCPAVSVKTPVHGWLGGATAGYNVQLTNWVVGVEGDMSWGKIDGTGPSNATFDCVTTCFTDIKSVGTIRGRVGYAFDRFLPYLTVGAAFTRIEAGFIGVAASTTTKTSLTWGGGVEYAFAPNWSAKLEYLRVEKTGNFVWDTVAACGVTPCYLAHDQYNLVRVGLNYRFGGDPWGKAPVVAKY